jgi:hypothetical protein
MASQRQFGFSELRQHLAGAHDKLVAPTERPAEDNCGNELQSILRVDRNTRTVQTQEEFLYHWCSSFKIAAILDSSEKLEEKCRRQESEN